MFSKSNVEFVTYRFYRIHKRQSRPSNLQNVYKNDFESCVRNANSYHPGLLFGRRLRGSENGYQFVVGAATHPARLCRPLLDSPFEHTQLICPSLHSICLRCQLLCFSPRSGFRGDTFPFLRTVEPFSVRQTRRCDNRGGFALSSRVVHSSPLVVSPALRPLASPDRKVASR